jgi:hypothetical protein
MTSGRKVIVALSTIVCALTAPMVEAQAAQRGPSCGILYYCHGQPGCYYGPGPCAEAQSIAGCSGTYESSWCSLIGCGGENSTACFFI